MTRALRCVSFLMILLAVCVLAVRYYFERWELAVFSNYVSHDYGKAYYNKNHSLPTNLDGLARYTSESLAERPGSDFLTTMSGILANMSPRVYGCRPIENGARMECNLEIRGWFRSTEKIDFYQPDRVEQKSHNN